MIILGERYHFTDIETQILHKKFNHISILLYKNFSVQENIKQLKNLLDTKESKTIVLNTQVAIEPELLDYLTSLELQGIEYISIENFMEKYLHRVIITERSFQLEYLPDIYKYTIFQKFQKRIIDYIGILFLLPITLFFIFYSYFRIKKESPGSIFFHQKRIGQEENEFNCIKLRSMVLDSEKNGPKFAEENDPRVFPWGETMRYTKIDELVQLWNVWKGDMHLIGPRPERKIWVQEFKKSIQYYTQRHIVPPGITGLAQIKYHYGRGEIDAKAKLEYDLYYIKNWSLKLEFTIIYETILFILSNIKKKLSKSSS